MKKFILYLGAFILVSIIAFLSFYYININLPYDKDGEVQAVVIESGASLKNIAKELKEEKLIQSSNLFILYARNKNLQSKLQAGVYNLSQDMSIKNIVAKISQGQVNSQEITVKLLEGWSNEKMAQYFESEGIWQKDEWLNVVGWSQTSDKKNNKMLSKYKEDYSFLESKPEFNSLEGYLFPDTYNIYKDSEPQDLVIRMLNNFNNKVTPQMREDIKEQSRSIHEIVTMASLIEKEANIKYNDDGLPVLTSIEEAKIISGIFWDRIARGQALQSCASLAYILGEYKTVYSTEDTKIESPYNTYQNAGLPPGPVSNPGIVAIKAAIYPVYTEYNYFLSPVGSDETLFSATYSEHLQKKAQFID
ncbi:MAG TPA: endolytic transglycosylase MltG [Patescibacteria group bacterium]|nr:endolytic transglycosylase MltG [Patescibacteria group bacterium]